VLMYRYLITALMRAVTVMKLLISLNLHGTDVVDIQKTVFYKQS